MDLRTGRTYATREEAIGAGVPESDVINVEEALNPRTRHQQAPSLTFRKKRPFASIRNKSATEAESDAAQPLRT